MQRGIPPTKKRTIYTELTRRTNILKRLHDRRLIISMSFTKSSQKPTEKVSSDNAVLSFDLLSNLTYMAALAAGSAPRTSYSNTS